MPRARFGLNMRMPPAAELLVRRTPELAGAPQLPQILRDGS